MRRRRRFAAREGCSDDAALVVGFDHARQVIAHCCPRCAARGVKPGMTLAHARALLTRLNVVEAPHQPQQDAAALRTLAAWAIRFSPLVAPDLPDGLVFDVTGCQRMYGDERRLLNAIGNTLERLGFDVRLACAGTVGCAWAVARFGSRDRVVVEHGEERAAVEPLLIESLRIDRATIDALHELNIDRVRDVLALPRLEVAARFDPMLLKRIDQALGHADEVINAIEPREPIVVDRAFDGAVTQLESLLLTGRDLTEQATIELAKIEAGAMRLDVAIERLGSPPIRLRVRLSRPTRDARHLWSLLRPRIEQVNMGFGVERIALAITAPQRMSHQQDSHWTNRTSASQAIDRASGELIDTLTDRLGAERAVCMRMVQSHVPERAVSYIPAMAAHGAPPRISDLADADRPSLVLEHPEPIDVMAVTPDGPPIWFRWRGDEHRIVAARGPLRIAGEWWRGDNAGSTRDYFSVQDESGRWLWLFHRGEAREDRVGGGGWFIHGQWT